jgi:hypothetical protein
MKGNVTYRLEEWGGGTPRDLHPSIYAQVFTRETREEWPLLSVETEANGDSKRTNERGLSFLVWFVGLFMPVQVIFVLPGLQSVQYKIFFSSPYTISIHLSPSPSKLGRQSFRIVCLLMCVCGFYSHLSLYPNFYLAFPSLCQPVQRLVLNS